MPGRHDALLFPSRRQEKQNYSALAQFSSLTLQEHEETMQHLQKQKEMIVQAMASLAEQESEANRRHKLVMEEIVMEEQDAMERLAATKQMIDSIDLKLSEERSDGIESIHKLENERRGMENELEELDVLEGQLKAMEAKHQGVIEELNERKRAAALEYEAGLSILDKSRQAARMAAVNVSKFGAGAASTAIVHDHPQSVQRIRATSPQRTTLTTTVSGGAYSGAAALAPMGAAQSFVASASANIVSQYQPRTLTPPRRSSAVTSPSKTFRSQSPPLQRATPNKHQQLLDRESGYNHHTSPVSNPNRPTGGVSIPSKSFVDTVRTSPPRVPTPGAASATLNASSTSLRSTTSATSGGRTALHVACSATGRDVDQIMDILKENAEIVNAVDVLGNTPLHCACSANDPSLEVVHALLLRGSSTTAKNEDGMTAFHLACLNSTDHDHKLKRFLIFKGAQNPNQRTGSGETVAHLCAAHDRHHDSLKYLLSVGLDLNVSALLPSTEPNQPARRATPLDVARNAGLVANKNVRLIASKTTK